MKKKELEELLHLIKDKFDIIVIYNKESKEYDIRCMELEKYKKKILEMTRLLRIIHNESQLSACLSMKTLKNLSEFMKQQPVLD